MNETGAPTGAWAADAASVPAARFLVGALATSLRWAARRALPAAGATVLMVGAAVAVQAISAHPVHAAGPSLVLPSSPEDDGGSSGDDLLSQLTASGAAASDESAAGDDAAQALTVGSLVDTVATLPGAVLPDSGPAPAPSAGLLDLSNQNPAQPGPSSGPLSQLLDGISSLVAPGAGDGSGQPQPGGWQPVTAGRLAPRVATTTLPVEAGSQPATPATGGAPTGGHAPNPLTPDQPMPQPVPSQAPAGGGLGTSLSSGPGMAVAALFSAPPLLSQAERPPCAGLPKWASAEVVAIVERPG